MSTTQVNADSSSLANDLTEHEPDLSADLAAPGPANGHLPSQVALAALTCPPRLAEFDEDDHRRGLRMRMAAALTVMQVVFGIGKELSGGYAKLAKDKKPVRGRASLFGKWVETYLPTFDRKTLDRWRLAYDTFAPLLAEEIQTQCLDFFDRFELSAVYALCHSQVTDDDRRAAIDIARKGRTVSKKKVDAIIEKPLRRAKSLQHKAIVLPAGKVTIAINHPDFRQALIEALSLLDDGFAE